ncbi:hypothetical protein JXJ21_09495 [candidate division KSB1 bacterium]|nr:hypothetical protein [candidate division KSB1 bacterium]
MKQTIQEKLIEKNFKPGIITKDGFLGNDERHIHDIIRADDMTLSRLGLTRAQIADRLQFFIELGKKAVDNEVVSGDFSVHLQWSRGMLPCPFGEPPLHYKMIVTVTNNKQNQMIRYSQLNVHMIREHGFFLGMGSTFRLEPEAIARMLMPEIENQQST